MTFHCTSVACPPHACRARRPTSTSARAVMICKQSPWIQFMVRPRVFQGNAGVAVLRTGMTPGWISTLAGVGHPHRRTYEDKRGPARI